MSSNTFRWRFVQSNRRIGKCLWTNEDRNWFLSTKLRVLWELLAMKGSSDGTSKQIHWNSVKSFKWNLQIYLVKIIRTHNVKLISIGISHTNVVVAPMNILFMFLTANKVLRVTFSLWQNFNIVQFHWVLRKFTCSPWKNVASINIVRLDNARKITIKDFSFQHQKCLE